MFAFSQMNLLSGSFLKLCLMFHIICLVIGAIMPFVHIEVLITNARRRFMHVPLLKKKELQNQEMSLV